MKVLLINVDSPDFNLAIRKLYAYHKKTGDDVDMIDAKLNAYPRKRPVEIDATGYDVVKASMLFEINRDRFNVVGCEDVTIAGVGSQNYELKLPKEVEDTDPYYFDDEETSYGFITRGCVNNCWFCKVPKNEGYLKFNKDWRCIATKKRTEFLDNNILAYPNHKDILRELADSKIRCNFKQGLDSDYVDEENAKLLLDMNYMGEYIMAFDSVSDEGSVKKAVDIFYKNGAKPWSIKLYIYHNAEKMKLKDLVYRVEWCRSHKVKPYVMRDQNCWGSKYESFISAFTSYCNQPGFFKKKTFVDFAEARRSAGCMSDENAKDAIETYRLILKGVIR